MTTVMDIHIFSQDIAHHASGTDAVMVVAIPGIFAAWRRTVYLNTSDNQIVVVN